MSRPHSSNAFRRRKRSKRFYYGAIARLRRIAERLWVLRLRGGDDGGRTTKLVDRVCDACAFAERHNADLCFEKVDIEAEENVSGDIMLCEYEDGVVR